MSEPQAGNHADLYEIDKGSMKSSARCLMPISPWMVFSVTLTQALTGRNSEAHSYPTESFPNACTNPRNGGDSKDDWLYDEEMYKERWKIERTNAWMDGFKAVLNRFDTTVSSWKGWNFLCFYRYFP